MFLKNVLSRNLLTASKKGYKMSQLHFYTGAGNTPSGIKVCIFGATSNIGSQLAAYLTPKGCPTVMVHRNPLDLTCPSGDDALFTKSNPYYTTNQHYLANEVVNYSLYEMRSWADVGTRYFQYVTDLTNEWDVEQGIKDCDVVINLIGNKKVLNYEEDYEEPNVIIPRVIAKKCAEKRLNDVKRLIHFSACGVSPDALSRRLKTKWLGEQEVKKHFPEATIIRPTSIFGNNNADTFWAHYLHNFTSNNGHIYMIEGGNCERQPVIDLDVCLAVYNILQLQESIGQTYELGGPHVYKLKELMEYLANILNHRPKFINMTYDDCMRIVLGPNSYFEKSFNWIMMRPDYLSELRLDIKVNKRDGIKTFEDLHIMPLSPQHFINDYGQFMMQRYNIDNLDTQDHDEREANDDAN